MWSPELHVPSSPAQNANYLQRVASCRRPRSKYREYADVDCQRGKCRPRSGSMPACSAYSRHTQQPRCCRPRRNRSHSQNDEEDFEEFYIVREFSLSRKGLMSRGDSLKQRSRSTNSSESSSCTNTTSSGDSRPTLSRQNSLTSDDDHVTDNVFTDSKSYTVIMVGCSGVGKTALAQQFTTSDYVDTFDTDPDDNSEITVSVLFDGEESELCFTSPSPDQTTDCASWGCCDAFLVVYSIADRASFHVAVDLVHNIRYEHSTSAIVLVGNKTDLARRRAVSQNEAKMTATNHECKYIETSAVLNHQVDELLVGLLSQIRLKEKHDEPFIENFNKFRLNERRGSVKKMTKWSVVRKLLKRDGNSCANMYVL